jgi:hypothetical protein
MRIWAMALFPENLSHLRVRYGPMLPEDMEEFPPGWFVPLLLLMKNLEDYNSRFLQDVRVKSFQVKGLVVILLWDKAPPGDSDLNFIRQQFKRSCIHTCQGCGESGPVHINPVRGIAQCLECWHLEQSGLLI